MKKQKKHAFKISLRGLTALLCAFVLFPAFSGCGDMDDPASSPLESRPIYASAEPRQLTPAALDTDLAGRAESYGIGQAPSLLYLELETVEHSDNQWRVEGYQLDNREFGPLYCCCDEWWVENGEGLAPGGLAEIIYSGNILTTSPGQISQPISMAPVDREKAFCHIFMDAFGQLQREASGLWDDAPCGVADLTGETNLSRQSEKYLLMQGIFHRYDRNFCESAWEDAAQGYFLQDDGTKLPASDGLFLRLTDTSAKDGTFTFSLEAYREGKGHAGYRGCTASFDGQKWNWEAGEFWTDGETSSQTLRLKACRVEKGRQEILAVDESDGATDTLYSFHYDSLDETGGALAPGMMIDVTFDGSLMETYPLALGGPVQVTTTGQENDFFSLYLSALETIWDYDSGLNPTSSDGSGFTLGFDFTEVHNLSEAEKEALGYVFSSHHDVQCLFSTFEELVEQGVIDAENPMWEDGLLFTIKDEPALDQSFFFNIQKWKSGLGAVGFDKCKAQKGEDGSWFFTEPDAITIS